MSIDSHFKDAGVKLTDGNILPSGQRAQRNVKRIIAAVRAAESEFNDELRAANGRCREAQEHVIELQDRCHNLESELKRFQINERLEEIEALTSADKQRLLEVSG